MTKRIIEVWGSSQRYKMHRNSQKGIDFEKTDLSKEKVQVGNSLTNYIEETYPVGHWGEFVYERDRNTAEQLKDTQSHAKMFGMYCAVNRESV